MMWKPVQTQVGEGSTSLIPETIVSSVDGIVNYVATNSTSQDVTLQAGLRLDEVQGCTLVAAAELLGDFKEKSVTKTDWRGWLGLRWLIMLAHGWAADDWWFTAVVAAAPIVSLLCALSLAAINVFWHVPSLAAWVHSVHHDPEDNDLDSCRQTTTRHKPKTRLNSRDPRCMELGDETIASGRCRR